MSKFVLFSLLFLAPFFVISQETEEEDGLRMFHREKRSKMTIPFGTKVVFSFKGEKMKGIIEDVNSQAIIIEGVEYSFYDLDWLGVRTLGSKISGIFLGVVGVGLISAGIIYLVGSSGLGFVGSGLMALSGVGIGSLSFHQLQNGRRYYLDSDWKIIPPIPD